MLGALISSKRTLNQLEIRPMNNLQQHSNKVAAVKKKSFGPGIGLGVLDMSS
jgi:hypothetical protein